METKYIHLHFKERKMAEYLLKPSPLATLVVDRYNYTSRYGIWWSMLEQQPVDTEISRTLSATIIDYYELFFNWSINIYFSVLMGDLLDDKS